MSVRRVLAVVGAVGLLVVAGCQGSSPRPVAPLPTNASSSGGMEPPGGATAAPTCGPASVAHLSTPDHVVVVIMENRAYQQVAGRPTAPFLNSVAACGALYTQAFAETHPSQPNYLALFSGSTHGVTDDHCPVRLVDQPNLAQQLAAAGRSFTGYSEDLPAAGFSGCGHDGYAAKHNPWVDFDNVPASANQPWSAFPTNFANLPTVSVVVPNLCHDMHDCSVDTGDRWLSQHLGGYLMWAYQHNSVLLVTFDEDDGHHHNQIFTVLAGAGVAAVRHSERVDHYTMLATVQEWYGLARTGGSGQASTLLAAGR